jgi:KAP family P-loop domain
MPFPPFNKDEIIKNISINDDQPDLNSDFFNFVDFSEQITGFLLDKNIPSPYTIGLHGEWGSGKTSLMGRVYKKIIVQLEQEQYSDYRLVWFDAWEYERLDPVSSLLYRISSEYGGNNSDRNKSFREKIKPYIPFLRKGTSVIATVAEATIGTPGISGPIGVISEVPFEELIKSSIPSDKLNPEPTITEELTRMIGPTGKLMVFVDDLDRCSINNALDILGAIKVFLNATGVIFIIAVDMNKLETAWELRHGSLSFSETGTLKSEGKDHVDKIFQLKLSLPLKDENEIARFVEKKAQSIPFELRNLITRGCPNNPRRIKRVLNLIRYLLITNKEDSDTFQKTFPVLVIWSICTLVYPDLSKIIRKWPQSLVQIALFVRYIPNFEDWHYKIELLKSMSSGTHYRFRENLIIPHNRIFNPNTTEDPDKILVKYPTVRALEYLKNNEQAYYFLKIIADLYNIEDKHQNNDLSEALMEDYGLTSVLSKVIRESGLI